MLLAEYNYDEDIKVQREEALEEGRIKEILLSVKEKDYPIETGMRKLNVKTIEEFLKLARQYGYNIKE